MVLGVLECGNEELLQHLFRDARLPQWLAEAPVEVAPQGGPTETAPPPTAVARNVLRAGALVEPVKVHTHSHTALRLGEVLACAGAGGGGGGVCVCLLERPSALRVVPTISYAQSGVI